MEKVQFTNYEKARILGARSLQIAMNAPLLMKIEDEKLEDINFNPIKISTIEFESEVLPITVNQPLPKKRSVAIKKSVSDDKKDEEKVKEEAEEEKEIEERGEIMELANPEDEEEPAEEDDSDSDEIE